MTSPLAGRDMGCRVAGVQALMGNRTGQGVPRTADVLQPGLVSASLEQLTFKAHVALATPPSQTQTPGLLWAVLSSAGMRTCQVQGYRGARGRSSGSSGGRTFQKPSLLSAQRCIEQPPCGPHRGLCSWPPENDTPTRRAAVLVQTQALPRGASHWAPSANEGKAVPPPPFGLTCVGTTGIIQAVVFLKEQFQDPEPPFPLGGREKCVSSGPTAEGLSQERWAWAQESGSPQAPQISLIAGLVQAPQMGREQDGSFRKCDSTAGIFKSLSHSRFCPWALVGLLHGRAFKKIWGRIWQEWGTGGFLLS